MLEMPENIWRQLTNAAMDISQAAQRRSAWAVVLGLVPFSDGARWCVLYGPDPVRSISGFGDTPEAAIWDFEKNFTCASKSQALMLQSQGMNALLAESDTLNAMPQV